MHLTTGPNNPYEAELSFPRLIQQLEHGRRGQGSRVPGIAYVESGEIVAYERAPFIEQLDSLPFCDFDLFDAPHRYVKSMVTSRGCPYRCVYCSTVKMWEKWRYRSAENVVNEMASLNARYATDTILFADDIFLVRRDRAEAICVEVTKRDLGINWGFSTRMETLKDDIIPILAESGVHAIFLGVESGSDRILQLMNRHYTADEVRRKIALCAEHGITCTASFIIGLPWEDETDVQKTFELMERVETPRVLLNIFTPLPGTESVERASALGIRILNGIQPALQVIGHGRVHHETQHLTAAQIEELWIEGQGIVMEKGRQGLLYLVRTAAQEYLEDPNVGSVGIGFRVQAGVRTNELCVQFGVLSKKPPEQLEALSIRVLPRVLERRGRSALTDVIQSMPRVEEILPVEETELAELRRSRLRPLRPGASISSAGMSAGNPRLLRERLRRWPPVGFDRRPRRRRAFNTEECCFPARRLGR